MSKQLIDQLRRDLRSFKLHAINHRLKKANLCLEKAEDSARSLGEDKFIAAIFELRINFGNQLTDLGDFAEAKTQYVSALKIAEDLTKNKPTNSLCQAYLALSLDNLGSSFIDTRQYEMGEHYCRRAYGILGKIYDENPEELRFKEYSAMNSRNLGTLLMYQGNYLESKVYFTKSIKIYDSLIIKDSKNITYITGYAASLNNFGQILTELGLYNDAKASFEKAIELNKKLLESKKESLFYKYELSLSLNNYGKVLGEMGRFETSEKCISESLSLSKDLLKKNPTNELYKSNLALTQSNLGSSFMNRGKYDEAKESIDNALKLYQELVDDNPEIDLYKYRLSVILATLGSFYINTGKYDEALLILEDSLKSCQKIIEKSPENIQYKVAYSIALDSLGSVLGHMEEYVEAKTKYENALEILRQLITYSSNDYFKSKLAIILNNYANIFSVTGEYSEAKQKYEESFEILNELLLNDSENQIYQAIIGSTLNNIGKLLESQNSDNIPVAKEYYEKALTIYSGDLDYKTIYTKSITIINLMKCNLLISSIETNQTIKLGVLKETSEICTNNKEFFIKYKLEYESCIVKLVGISAHIQYLMLITQNENNTKKRIEGYETCISFVEKYEDNDCFKSFEEVFSPIKNYLKGRLLINIATESSPCNTELIAQAVECFKLAKDSYPNAQVCYCIYSGLLEINNIQVFTDDEISKAKERLQNVIDALPEKNYNIKCIFEEIKCLFDEEDVNNGLKLILKLNAYITKIDHNALREHFFMVVHKIASYLEEPYKPNVYYNNWELTIMFDDPEKISDKIIITAGNDVLFEGHLGKRTKLFIEYQPRVKEENIEFVTSDGRKIQRRVSYYETIKCDKPIDTFLSQKDFTRAITSDYLKIAIVQLKYHLYKEDNAIKVRHNDNYCKKIKLILEAVREKVDIIVFPELSIPFDYLSFLKAYSENNGITIVAGSHYVTEESLKSCSDYFDTTLEEKDLLKNICPIIIPSSKIIHTEKICGSKFERALFFDDGMTNGNLNCIFKLNDVANCGVLICYDFLKEDLRQRVTKQCNIIFVPQANPKIERFEEVARYELNNPRGPGNKAFIMANGIFSIDHETSMYGGSSGLLLTLDKDSHQKDENAIIKPIEGIMEQFILLASLNIKFFAGRETQQAQIPLTEELIHIYEIEDLLQSQKNNVSVFLDVLSKISSCDDRDELKQILTTNKEVIHDFSPLMNKGISVSLENLRLNEIKRKCSSILV